MFDPSGAIGGRVLRMTYHENDCEPQSACVVGLWVGGTNRIIKIEDGQVPFRHMWVMCSA